MTTWTEFHKASEAAAIQAELIARGGAGAGAATHYAEAARLEQQALGLVDPAKVRTKGITAVSAVALWYKAGEYDRAEALAFATLADPSLPQFARKDLRDLVQAIWTESSKREARVQFLPGQVLVSIKGGEVTTGGAPLDLIVEKVQSIQSMFFRVVELMKDMPFRRRGAAPGDIQESCRPWLFQAAPGSYQFAVAIQEPKQRHFFREDLPSSSVAQKFFEVLEATAAGDARRLEVVVPGEEYRAAFLKLSRNLAPAGNSFQSIEFRDPSANSPILLDAEARTTITQLLRHGRSRSPAESEQIVYHGMLYAVDLEKDFLRLRTADSEIKIEGLEEALDDVIGPMVNKRVTATVYRSPKGVYRLHDIELAG
ncbi:MAG: hypothetical protein U0Q16_14535 [Bryobacteraceae bacterium]